jgi:hypothetical protein
MAKVVVMNVDDWLGVGCILAGITAFAVSIVTLNNRKNCTLSDHYKLDTALMWGSLFLSLGSFVPQLVKNEQLKSDMDDSISLFVPIIGPLIILTRVRRSLRHKSDSLPPHSQSSDFRYRQPLTYFERAAKRKVRQSQNSPSRINSLYLSYS